MSCLPIARPESSARREIDRELADAARVQALLLPSSPPAVPGLDLAGACLPARAIGGDFYDFLAVRPGWLGLAVADVMGKGAPAALLAAAARATLRAEARRSSSPRRVLSRVNRALYEDLTGTDSFLTMFFANLDLHRGLLHYCDAAHMKPVLARARGGIERLETEGLLLGAAPRDSYREKRTDFGPGDVLVLFSDGVTLAGEPRGEAYGETGLIETIEAGVREGCSARELVDRVVEAATSRERRARARDDLTVAVARRAP